MRWRRLPILATLWAASLSAVALLASACSSPSSEAQPAPCGGFPKPQIAILYACDLTLANSHVIGPCGEDNVGIDELVVGVAAEGTCRIYLTFSNGSTASAAVEVTTRSQACGSGSGSAQYLAASPSTVVVGDVVACGADATPSCACVPENQPDGSVVVVEPTSASDAGAMGDGDARADAATRDGAAD